MEKVFFKDTFDRVASIANGEYEQCSFTSCDLGEADLSEAVFINCVFAGCNLSMAKLTRATFRDVSFIDCKMLGLKFGDCNEFGLSFRFERCVMDHCSFYRSKIKNTIFKDCRMHEVDLAECDMSCSVLDNCDLAGASFDATGLEKADLRNSINYSIDPDRNRIKKAKFSLHGAIGLLDKYDIEVEN